MMKKFVFVILLFIPFIVNAACDKQTISDYTNYASDIIYEKQYDKSKDRFSITFYNVIDEISLSYNDKTYKPSEGKIKIDNLKEGISMIISVVATKCNQAVRTIYIDLPYYNNYYGSTLCKGYVDKITYCTENFTESEVSENLIKLAIKNYNHVLEQPEDEVVQEEPSLMKLISEFTKKWSVRVVLVLITSFITNMIFSNIYIKIKHKL